MYTSINIDTEEAAKRREALAVKLNLPITDVEFTDGDVFCAEGAEYLVLTDDEADAELIDNVRESAWAFSASFILSYCRLHYPGAEEALEAMQSAKCEGANPFILALIEKEKGGIEDFARQAEAADGRGHFLSGYDGDELELAGGYFAYRVN